MIEPITITRKYFSESLSRIGEGQRSSRRRRELLNGELVAEFGYRSGLIRGKIIGLGLLEHMGEIVEGMNQCADRICPSDKSQFKTGQDYQHNTRANSDALLAFGMDYIDRWVMYNDLFKQS
mgnify:CR=1 FL=1|jgi:hypothetical protein